MASITRRCKDRGGRDARAAAARLPPGRSVRDCYLEAGVAPGRVHVIPLGVDPEVFRPGLAPLALPPGPDLRFLFVGGTIFRKGIDLLLSAFARAFKPSDGVGLVIGVWKPRKGEIPALYDAAAFAAL